MQEQYIKDNLIIDGKDFIFTGDLNLKGTIRVNKACLAIEGDLFIQTSELNAILVTDGIIVAHSITATSNICLPYGSIYVSGDLNCLSVFSSGDEIVVGGNANVFNVNCRNYLIDGNNNSGIIFASESVYILGNNDSSDIYTPELFIGDDANFNRFNVISDHFESGGHIYNCYGRYDFTS